MNIKGLNQTVVRNAGIKALAKVLPQLNLQQLDVLEAQVLDEKEMLLNMIKQEKDKRSGR